MDYPETSDTLRAKLAGTGKHEARRQADRVNKGPGAATDRAARQGARHEGGDMEVGGIDETRMRKTARYTKNGAALLMLVISR